MPIPKLERFTSKGSEEGFALIEERLAKYETEDPNTARYSRVGVNVHINTLMMPV
ncbi:hypothetical protein SK128_002384 [Halocaridina rubra]|uniref:Uncharacterized protein n=1 Tax=Halocaridina rubra TaxID=373956 RepID=A0AAN8X6V8_HALRR